MHRRFSRMCRLMGAGVLLLPAPVMTTAGSAAQAGTLPPAPSMSINAAAGPPTTKLVVAGSGFGATERVQIRAAGAPVGSAISNADGRFSVAGITIPANAQPGALTLTAVGQVTRSTAHAVFTVRTDWAQAGFGVARQGLNPYENSISPGNAASLVNTWVFKTHKDVQGSVSVVHNVAYFGSGDGLIFAVSTITHRSLWFFVTGGEITSEPAVVDGTVYVGSIDHKVYALSAATGALKWSFTADDLVVNSPAVAQGIVYVGSYDDHVYALDARTGALRWQYLADSLISSTPAVANGLVYVSNFVAGEVVALHADTGVVAWKTTLSNSGSSGTSPTVIGEVLYIADNTGSIRALNALTGAVEWTYSDYGALNAGSLAVADHVVYAGSGVHGNLIALDAATGTLRWSSHAGQIESAPVVANGVVYAASLDHSLYAFDAITGAKLWSYATHDLLFGSPTVVNGVVYQGSFDRHLYAFGL